MASGNNGVSATGSDRMSPRESPTGDERVFFYLVLALLAWLPIPLGSNRPWSMAVLEVGSLSLLSAWALYRVRRPAPLPDPLRRARAAVLLLLGWLAYQLFQILPLPADLLSAISPSTLELFRYTLGEPLPGWLPLSIDVESTQAELLRNCAYVSFFVLVLALANSRERVRQLAYVLVISGLANVLYGFANHFSVGALGFAGELSSRSRAVLGTYPNYNHFAGLMEMTIPMALGIGLGLERSARYYPHWKARLQGISQWLLSGKGLLAVVILILSGGLIFSTSRGGLLSFLAGMALTIILFILLRGRQTREARFAPLIPALLIGAVAWLGTGGLKPKLEHAGLVSERPLQNAATYPLVGDYPLFGSGSGTYRWIFPLYKTPDLSPQTYGYAHNDYLELLAGQGLIGASLLGGGLVAAWMLILQGVRRRRDPVLRGILFGATGGMLSLLAHAFGDFNFQIPANAAIFFCLLAGGISAAVVPGGRRRRSRAASRSKSEE